MSNSHPLPEIYTNGGNSRFVRALTNHGAAFLIIGGTAAMVHGARDALDVDDLDILIDHHPENVEIVVSQIAAHNFQSVPVERLAKPSIQVPMKAWDFWLDILTPHQEESFSELLERSAEAKLDFTTVKVIGKSDLINMKKRAVQALGNEVAKHRRDLERLELG